MPSLDAHLTPIIEVPEIEALVGSAEPETAGGPAVWVTEARLKYPNTVGIFHIRSGCPALALGERSRRFDSEATLPGDIHWKPCGRCAKGFRVKAVQYDGVLAGVGGAEGAIEELISDLDRRMSSLKLQITAGQDELDTKERLREAAVITLEALKARRETQ